MDIMLNLVIAAHILVWHLFKVLLPKAVWIQVRMQVEDFEECLNSTYYELQLIFTANSRVKYKISRLVTEEVIFIHLRVEQNHWKKVVCLYISKNIF